MPPQAKHSAPCCSMRTAIAKPQPMPSTPAPPSLMSSWKAPTAHRARRLHLTRSRRQHHYSMQPVAPRQSPQGDFAPSTVAKKEA